MVGLLAIRNDERNCRVLTDLTFRAGRWGGTSEHSLGGLQGSSGLQVLQGVCWFLQLKCVGSLEEYHDGDRVKGSRSAGG